MPEGGWLVKSFNHWVTGGDRPYVARCLSCGLRLHLTPEERRSKSFEESAASLCPHCGARDLRINLKERRSNLLLLGVVALMALLGLFSC